MKYHVYKGKKYWGVKSLNNTDVGQALKLGYRLVPVQTRKRTQHNNLFGFRY